jgi:hypothetical protein
MGDAKEHFELEPTDDMPESATPIEPKPPVSPPHSPPHSSPHSPAPSGAPLPPQPLGAKSPAEAPPLLELAEDKCPKCGMNLRHDAVFCIKCGYDLRTNEVRKLKVGVEVVAEKPPEEAKEFSTPGRGNVKLLLGIGGAITLGAMVMAGLHAPPGFRVVAAVILSLYEIILHTGTGMVAVLIAARIAELKPGNLELAAARMLAAFSSFQLIHSISFGEYPTLVKLLMYPLALAAYFGLIMLLFRKPRAIVISVLVAHAVLWLAVEAGMELASYVHSAPPPPAQKSVEPPPAG